MIHTIRAKLIVGFFLIFSVFFLILNVMVTKNIESSNHKIINDNLIGLKKNSTAYVRQSFMIHHFANDEVYFGQIAEEMVKDLQYDTSSEIGMYSLDGELLYSSDITLFATAGDDLKQAIEGKTAYTLSYPDGQASVHYSYPVVVDGAKVGIMRFVKDFTLLYEQSNHIQRTNITIALAVFAAAFLFSYLLSRHITVPLIKLTKASTEVMNGNLDLRITFRRKDEIGRLATNFSSMIEKIRSQFTKIEKDRDRLEQLNLTRKQFYDNVTHELKTPLTTIMGYAEIIRKNGEKDPIFFDKGMNHIIDESKRLHDMVLKLLERSMETEGSESLVLTDSGRILRDVCETMTIKAQRYRKTIHYEVEDGLLVLGHADKLRQLFINLLDNAIKYGYAHSEIHVQARLYSGSIGFTFSNQGETISPDHLARIFEPFYRADLHSKEADSIGLGLGISKGIVEEHKGSIRIASELEQINVYINIPYTNEARER